MLVGHWSTPLGIVTETELDGVILPLRNSEYIQSLLILKQIPRCLSNILEPLDSGLLHARFSPTLPYITSNPC